MTAISNRQTGHRTDVLAARFHASMERLGPFEALPHLAVAVSGGADSTALALLSRDWANADGGRVTALIVDHGLRACSRDEARTTAARLQALGLTTEILTWGGPHPDRGLQAAAREARYGLLRGWCRKAGVLHLLCGHHADDQMETHLMRIARGPGLGTAGMSAIREFSDVRLLRPLLSFRRMEIETFLRSRGISWVEDPSNLNDGFERVRMRKRLTAEAHLVEVAASGLSGASLTRVQDERDVTTAIARAVSMDARGFAWLRRDVLRHMALDHAAQLVGRLCLCLGGADHTPARDRARRLAKRLTAAGAFPGASLGRCRFLAEASRGVLVCRDTRGLPQAVPAVPGPVTGWDGRFSFDLPAGQGKEVTLAPLGAAGWRQLGKDIRRASGLSLATARTLPAVFDAGKVVISPLEGGESGLNLRFRPKNSLAFNGFCIA